MKDVKKRVFIPVKEFSKGQKSIMVMVLVFCLIVQFIVLVFFNNMFIDRKVSKTRIYGESVASAIVVALNESVNTTQLLKDLYMEYDQVFLKDFDLLCDRFMKDNIVIGSLYTASADGTVTHSFPATVAPKTQNFNTLKDPKQGAGARLAMESKAVTVTGPYALIEGGTGFIIRNPVYKNNEFKGFTIAVLDTALLKFRISRLNSIRGSGYYKIAVAKDDTEGCLTDSYGYIWNSTSSDVSHKVDIPVNVPNDLWHLYLEPEDGWQDIAGLRTAIIISALAVLFIVLFVYFRQVDQYKKIYAASHDRLTGLYTRDYFTKKVEQLFKDNPNTDYDVLISDIENFKVINTVFSSEKGDEVLRYMADFFLHSNPTGYTARFSGDKFICIIPSSDFRGFDFIEDVVGEAVKDSPIPTMQMKFGYYGKVDKKLKVSLICDRALIAVRSVLHNYDRMVANYDGPVSHENMRMQLLESAFEGAIQNDEFQVWYQPQFDAFTEKLTGIEALVRWDFGGDGRIVSPGEFISIFEKDGLITRLDEYVFRRVCQNLRLWIDSGMELKPISVNLSRITLQHRNIIRCYAQIVEEFNIPLNLLTLEITESASSSNLSIQNLTKDLKDCGFSIHMDDFGTGLSSLESINILPFDAIKLDKSLVDFIGTPDGEELLRVSIELAHFKHMTVIAEGVETKEQLDFLRSQHCDIIQGYYFAAPKPLEKCMEYHRQLVAQGRV